MSEHAMDGPEPAGRVDSGLLSTVAAGTHWAPHDVLGAHPAADGSVTIRVLRHLAQAVEIVIGDGGEGRTVPLRHEQDGIWTVTLPAVEAAGMPPATAVVPPYRIRAAYPDGSVRLDDDAYRHLPTVSEHDLHLFGEGSLERLWEALGARPMVHGGAEGTAFSVWAPNARAVRVIGDFNAWDGRETAMRSLGSSGVWELFVPGVGDGAVYKFEILPAEGAWLQKADPMARRTEVPPRTGSIVTVSQYEFRDEAWLRQRAQHDPAHGPMSVYEVHLGSWRPGLGYRELADELVAYVTGLGFTHVEFLPVAEHPFGGSWGYQVTSYYAPTSRFGHPDDFKALVDALHAAGIGVLLDWVPAHFPKDEWALARFDGQPLYEHPDPRRGEHPDWGTLIFDYGRREVRNFLTSNALYWLEEFHIDGLRVDAVASMLYLDYSREDGQWLPNEHGGRENLEAIDFLRHVNGLVAARHPGTAMIAEESTAFPGVTAPGEHGGLGFTLKWNMGWMNDSLRYVSRDPIHRAHHHHDLTFSLVYAFSERYLLPISHDEVVHGKGSLLRKLPGDRWQQLAGLRSFLAYQWAHPGKQLIFMGTEFGQEAEWSEQHGLDWWLTDDPRHSGVQRLVRDLNALYTRCPALYERDADPLGFQWLEGADAEANVISFVRWDLGGRPLVCVVNFSGITREGHAIPMPATGSWAERVNTDAEIYGGAGAGNLGRVHAVDGGFNGFPAHARLTLPAFGALLLEPLVPGE